MTLMQFDVDITDEVPYSTEKMHLVDENHIFCDCDL